MRFAGERAFRLLERLRALGSSLKATGRRAEAYQGRGRSGSQRRDAGGEVERWVAGGARGEVDVGALRASWRRGSRRGAPVMDSGGSGWPEVHRR